RPGRGRLSAPDVPACCYPGSQLLVAERRGEFTPVEPEEAAEGRAHHAGPDPPGAGQVPGLDDQDGPRAEGAGQGDADAGCGNVIGEAVPVGRPGAAVRTDEAGLLGQVADGRPALDRLRLLV